MTAPELPRKRSERGSAVADFTLVAVVLIPLFFAIFQLALIWHVKNTLTSAASEGARYGAAYDHTAADGAARTAASVDSSFGSDFDASVQAGMADLDGHPVVHVDVKARVPVLAFWGPTLEVEASGHAIKEVLP